MRRLKVAVIAAGLTVGLAGIPAYGVPSVANGRIAFVANVTGHPQVFTIGADGTGLLQVTHRASGVSEYGTAWSTDGSTLLFVVSGNRDLIYKSATDGSAAARVSPACTGPCLGDDFPVYTRSGTKIAFERAFGPIRNDNAAVVAIFTMNADGTGLAQLTQKKTPTSTEDHKPTWSPDGRRIAFQRLNLTAAPRNVGAIFAANADGSNVRRLTPFALNASNPKWSRNGTSILCNSYDEPAAGKDTNIYTIRPDGTGLTQLTRYTGGKLQAYVGDWSPDGKEIVFHLRGADPNAPGINQLFVMNADGSDVRQLTHMAHGTNPRNAAWGTAG